MKGLVYGAGVIGCYLTHVLCEAGNDVTLLARGNWRQTLEEKGLVIRHHLQRKTTLDHPRIISQIAPEERYDVVFSVMSYHQTGAILEDLGEVNAEIIVLVGNNLSAKEMEQSIRAKADPNKQILFGFQVTAGKRETDHAICERMGAGAMDIGLLDTPTPEVLQQKLNGLFRGTDYQLRWQDNMESFFKCHADAILPLCFMIYGAGGDCKRTTEKQRKQSMKASVEGYDLLLSLGYSIVPKGDDDYYRSGLKRFAMGALLFFMSKTVIGELVAAAHCRHAVAEMEALDVAWEKLRAQYPGFPMPNWDALRTAMPDWAELHRLYDQPGQGGHPG